MVFIRTKARTTGKPLETRTKLKSVMAVIRCINKYKNREAYPGTLRLECLSDEGDLLYYYDAETGTEEIYKADGSITSDVMKMGCKKCST